MNKTEKQPDLVLLFGGPAAKHGTLIDRSELETISDEEAEAAVEADPEAFAFEPTDRLVSFEDGRVAQVWLAQE